MTIIISLSAKKLETMQLFFITIYYYIGGHTSCIFCNSASVKFDPDRFSIIMQEI